MNVRRAVDIAVVGNGVLGLSIALEVARRAPDLRVVVVGPDSREGGASAAAGAMLNCFGEVTQYTAKHPATRAKFAIARKALDEWPAWLEQLADEAGPDCQAALRASHSRGTFMLLSGKAGRIAAENFQAVHAALIDHGEPYDEVDPQEIEGLAPRPDARPMRALHLHREGAVDARAVLTALEVAARGHGVETVADTVQALMHSAGTVHGVRLADGTTLSAGTVVLAAGSMSGSLADDILPLGAVPPMLHGTGLALVTKRAVPGGVPHVVRTPNRAATCGAHVLPLAEEGQQYIGANSYITRHPTGGPQLGVSQGLLHLVCDQIDHQLALSTVQRWLCGARPIPLDCFPLIGPCSARGLVLATGTYRDGFHCSPVIARHIADRLLQPGLADDPRFAWFLPERAPIETLTVREAVAEAVRHEVETTIEYGLQLPYWLDMEPIDQYKQQLVERFYGQLDEPVGLPPEITMALRTRADNSELAHLNAYLRAARTTHDAPSPLVEEAPSPSGGSGEGVVVR